MRWCWTDKKPNRPGPWARRVPGNSRSWRVVQVWRNKTGLYIDDFPLSGFLIGFWEWSDRPVPEPLSAKEPKKKGVKYAQDNKDG